ncbi:MAG TPA: DUF2071 domain-containing protein [Pirellulales bacterium]|nr:DUF2071 domain-containing protein [Pirellulales bacterium]
MSALLTPTRPIDAKAAKQVAPAAPGRVFLSARWHALAMLNYEIDPAVLRPLVPRGTELDTHDGKTFVSMVGFLFLGTRVLGYPIPLHRNFEEVNLRFYVRREVGGETRRAVAFVKEIVPRWAIATTACWVYNEPYAALPMRHSVGGAVARCVCDASRFTPKIDASIAKSADCVAYSWRFAGRWNRLSLVHEGQPAALVPGSHEEFIAEHYWGYCAQRDGRTVEYRVAHPPWRVWTGTEAELDCDVAALYDARFAPFLKGRPASAFLADGSEVTVMRPMWIT